MKKILTIILVILILSLALFGCSKKDDSNEALAEQEKLIAVEIEHPKLGDISQSSTLNGKLQPVHTVTIIPEVAGMAEIQQVKVKLGDTVRKGDILFTLDNENVQDQIESLRLSYETSQRNYDKVKEGLDNAKINLERTQKLYEAGAVSEQQYEQAKLAASDTQLAIIEAQLEQSRVAYENAAKQLDNALVTAPIGGVVTSINIQEGGMASAQPALVITDISKLEVEIHITEEMLPKIKAGQQVELIIPTIGNERIEATVQMINPVPDPMTQLYKGKIEVKNVDNHLKPGMFAQVYLDTEARKQGLIIPSVAVIQEEENYFVFTVAESQSIKKAVEIGLDNGEIVEILSGIKAEDAVIVKGQDFVKDGAKVKVVRGEVQ